MQPEELKSCPFCGWKPDTHHNSTEANIYCPNPDCGHGQVHVWAENVSNWPDPWLIAIAAWNRRSVTSQASEGADEPIVWITPEALADIKANHPATAGAIGEFRTDGHHDDFTVPLYASPSKRVERLEPATHRHVKRGTEYVLLGYGKMQAENWHDMSANPHDFQSVDMREVAIYRSVDDGSLWVRPREEFEDGRFQALQGGRS